MTAYQYLLQNGPGLAWVAGGCCAVLASFYPQTVGLKEYQEQMTCRTNGKPDAVDTEVLLLAERVKTDLKWDESHTMSSRLLELTQTPNLEWCHGGSLASKWGAFIGVPMLFSTKSIEKASENEDILLKHNIDLKSPDGKEILKTFSLSSDAKKFVLAREMCYVKSLQIYINSCSLGLAVTSCFVMAQILSSPFHFRGSKFLSYLTAVPSVMAGYIKGSDSYNRYMDAKVDRKAAMISESVAYGGVEYYTALSSQRQLLGNNRSKTLTIPNIVQTFGQEWRKTELDPIERKSRLLEFTEQFYSKAHSLES